MILCDACGKGKGTVILKIGPYNLCPEHYHDAVMLIEHMITKEKKNEQQ